MKFLKCFFCRGEVEVVGYKQFECLSCNYEAEVPLRRERPHKPEIEIIRKKKPYVPER